MSEELMGGDILEDMGVDGRVISEFNLEKRCESVNWIHLAQSRDKWRALVEMVMNLWVP